MSTTTIQLQNILKEKVKTSVITTSLEFSETGVLNTSFLLSETKLYELVEFTKNWFVKYTALKNAGMTIFKELPTPEIFDIFDLITSTNKPVFEAIESYDLNQLVKLFFMINDKKYLSIKDYIKETGYDEYVYKLLKIYEMRNNTDYNDMGIIRLREIQEKINAL